MDEEKQIKYYSVTQYNTSIKNYLDGIPQLNDVHIKGEISNWKEGSFLLKHHYKLLWIKGLVAIISQEGFPSG